MSKKIGALIIAVIMLGFLAIGLKLAREKFAPEFANPGQNFYTNDSTEPVVASVSGVIVIFPKTDNYTDLMQTLQTILKGDTMGRKIKEVDLRFDKPIIRYGT